MLENVKQILKEKAPLIVDAFQGPANESSFAELENITQSKLPLGLKSLYLNSNGFSPDKYANLFYGLPFIPMEDIVSRQKGLKLENDALPLQFSDDGIKGEYTFGVKRVPIGDDSGTSLLCVDLDPDETGEFGQILLLDYEMGVALKLNKSIEDLLQQFEHDLFNDKYSLQEDALEDGVHWLKPIREIDPGNWFNSPRWQYVNEALKNS